MINWLTALKFLPWSDMIEYAPKVVSGAQKVWQRVKTGKDAIPSEDANSLVPTDPLTELQILQQELRSVQTQQVDLTNVIKDLAGQNQRLVEAVNVLRVRTRVLIVALALNIIGTVTWVALA